MKEVSTKSADGISRVNLNTIRSVEEKIFSFLSIPVTWNEGILNALAITLMLHMPVNSHEHTTLSQYV